MSTQTSDHDLFSTREVDPDWAAWLAEPPDISLFTNDAGYLASGAMMNFDGGAIYSDGSGDLEVQNIAAINEDGYFETGPSGIGFGVEMQCSSSGYCYISLQGSGDPDTWFMQAASAADSGGFSIRDIDTGAYALILQPDGSGYLANSNISWDSGGDFVAHSFTGAGDNVTLNGNTLESLCYYDGVVVFWANATNATNAQYAQSSATDFLTFFNDGPGGDQGYTINGSNGDFLQSNGYGSGLDFSGGIYLNGGYLLNFGGKDYGGASSSGTSDTLVATDGDGSNLTFGGNKYNTVGFAGSLAGSSIVFVDSPGSGPTSNGTTGQIAQDGTYLYACIGANSWVRASLSTLGFDTW